jgi:hypothetical protein
MDRQPSRSGPLSVALLVAGVLAAVAIAVAFDPPTSVVLLLALVLVFGLVTILASRRARR